MRLHDAPPDVKMNFRGKINMMWDSPPIPADDALSTPPHPPTPLIHLRRSRKDTNDGSSKGHHENGDAKDTDHNQRRRSLTKRRDDHLRGEPERRKVEQAAEDLQEETGEPPMVADVARLLLAGRGGLLRNAIVREFLKRLCA